MPRAPERAAESARACDRFPPRVDGTRALGFGRPRRSTGFTRRALFCELGACLMLAMLASGCVTVKSYQRGQLAHRCMTPNGRAAERRAELHLLGARESSRGASGETGGGCGCR